MRIKVFKAADLKEAMAMVKDELGRDAVILHTKRYKQGGFLGYKSKEIVEVTAAVDDAPRRPRVRLPAMPRTRRAPAAPPASSRPAVQPPVPPRNVLEQYKTAGTEAGVNLARSAELSARMEQAPAESAFVPMEPETLTAPRAETIKPQQKEPMLRIVSETPAPIKIQPETIIKDEARIIVPPENAREPDQSEASPRENAVSSKEEETMKPEAEISPAESHDSRAQVFDEPAYNEPQKSAETSRRDTREPSVVSAQSQEKINALEDELAQMRQMLRQVMSQSDRGEDVTTLRDTLKAQELREDVMQDIIRKIPPATLMLDKEDPEAIKGLSEYLHSVLKTGDGIGLKDGRPKIVALIGTTGVGKTTTIAKIAAKFVLERGVSVALVTADTYRISAVDQLKTYSDIIGLPLEIVYSPAELKPALKKHKDKKLILIDTAGRSQNNDYQMQELKEFLAADSSIEKHLVMSATTKERDAEAILDRFASCRPDRILLTKTDETESVGFMVNLLFDRRLALSYFTNGQSVPDDIEPARPELLAKLLLR